jgi:hypothetical protein
MKLKFVDRIAIINSILDRVNEGQELTDEMRELLKEMSK